MNHWKVFLIAAFGMGFAISTHALPPMDTCARVVYRGDLSKDYLGGGPQGQFQWNVVLPADPSIDIDAAIFVVNANGHGDAHYYRLAEHLARYGYLVRIISRDGAGLAVDAVRAAIQETFAHFYLPADFPLALVGHSVGGGSVIETARLYAGEFNIRAVATIAPNVESVPIGFVGSQVPAYLGIYGSQDEDMSGTYGVPREAFAAYDRINTEETTASPYSRHAFVTANALDKAMIYVNGADHSGFLFHPGEVPEATDFDYLSPADQHCIAKAYLTGFLQWRLRGESVYRDLLTGDMTLPSLESIVTAEEDYAGRPAGSPLRIYHQFSARKRFVIANFWSVPAFSVDTGVYASVIYPYTVDPMARHYTTALMLRWRSRVGQRKLEIDVPVDRRNIAAFDRLQLRIGQIRSGDVMTANLLGGEPELGIDLVDGQGMSAARLLNSYGSIPGPDRRPPGNGTGHSHMTTLSIPMSEFDSIDLSDVRHVRFWVTPGTRGEVMIDNIEASYDY